MSGKGLLIVAMGTACVSASLACQSTRVFEQHVERVFESEDYIRIRLDGWAAEQQALKKIVPGWSQWTVHEPISLGPTLFYQITKPERLGRITYVRAAIHRAFDGAYSSQPEFVIVSREPRDAASQLKPNIRYDLSTPTEGIRISDVTGREVPQVALEPGTKYQLVLTLKADKSQTAIVYFTTP